MRIPHLLRFPSRTIRLGITGLERTGKTVFVTALLHQMLECGSKGFDAFAAHNWKLYPGHLVPQHGDTDLAGRPRSFPYTQYLKALRADPPGWPDPTKEEFEAIVRFAAVQIGGKAKPRTITLHIHDYPGEWLVDAPLSRCSFRDWSRDMWSRMEERAPSLAVEYRENHARAAGNPDLDPASVLPTLRRSYAAFVQKEKKNGLAPAMALLNTPADDLDALATPESLPFIPLPPDVPESEKLTRFIRSKYDAYVAERVRPFVKRLSHHNVQLILVDVLRLLQDGKDAYNEFSATLGRIVQAHVSGTWPSKELTLIYVATKADHVLGEDRPNLAHLAHEVAQKAAGALVLKRKNLIERSEFLAAVCATQRCTGTNAAGEWMPGLRPTARPNAAGFSPPKLPKTWEEANEMCEKQGEKWGLGNRTFQFARLMPPKFSPVNTTPHPHLNLDEVLYRIFSSSLD